MTYHKKVGNKSDFFRTLWASTIVYLLLISALFAISVSVVANNPPEIAIMEPEGGAIVSGNVTVWMVAWDLDGDEQIEDVWVRIDDGDWLNATYNHTDAEGQWWYFEWDTTTVEDGCHHITGIVYDGIAYGDDLIEVIVDNAPENNPPHIEIIEPTDGETVYGTIVIWMVAWDADGNDEIQEVWVRIDGGDLLNATYNHTDSEGQWWYFEWNTTTVSDGVHSITAIVFDGTDDASHEIEVIVDNVPENNPPGIEIVEPAGGSTVSGVVMIWMVAWDADGHDDIQDVWVRIDGGDLLNATYDHTDHEGQWWYFEWDTTTVSDGWHSITAVVFDGTDDAHDVIEVLVDNSPENHPPHVEIVEPANGEIVSGTIEIWIRAWDADGPHDIEMVFVKIDGGSWHEATFVEIEGDYSWWVFEWDTTIVEDGEHHIYAKTTDGHLWADDHIEVFVDNEGENSPPHVEITHPPHGSTLSGTVTIWMVAWDADGNDQIQDVWVRIDGGDLINATYHETTSEGQWWYYEWDTTEVDDGWHWIKATVYDGIDDGHDVVEYLIDNVPENSPPQVEITQPEHGETVSGQIEILLRAWDPDGVLDVEMVFVRIDGGSWEEATFIGYEGDYSYWVFEWDTTSSEDGEHHIHAKAWDGQDHSEPEVIMVMVENEGGESPWMSGILPLLILAGLIGGVALVLAGTEVGTMAFMSLVFLPLYTKLSKNDVLDHFVRGQIFGYIKINPGDNYTTIKKNLELNNGTLTYHLNVLEKEGLIKSWSNGSHKYFYPMGVTIPGNGVKNPSIHDAILKSIKDSPGISVSDIAAVNGISKQLANYHIRKMAAEGTIELERKSFSKLCYPVNVHMSG